MLGSRSLSVGLVFVGLSLALLISNCNCLEDDACPMPPEDDDELVSFTTTSANDTSYEFAPGTNVTYRCVEGYISWPSSYEITCETDGEWSSPSDNITVCQAIKCSELDALSNGQISYSTKFNASSMSYPFATLATVTCTTGFSVAGAVTRTCGGGTNGTWSGEVSSCVAGINLPTFGFTSTRFVSQRGVDNNVQVCVVLISGSVTSTHTISIQATAASSGSSIYTLANPLPKFTFPANTQLNSPVCQSIATIGSAMPNVGATFMVSMTTSPMAAIMNSPATVTINAITPPTFGLTRPVFARAGDSQITACVRVTAGTTLTIPYIVTATVTPPAGYTAATGAALMFPFPKGSMLNQEVCRNVATRNPGNNTTSQMDTPFMLNLAVSPPTGTVAPGSLSSMGMVLGPSTPLFGLSRPIIARRVTGVTMVNACLKLISGGPLTQQYEFTPTIAGGVGYMAIAGAKFTFPMMSSRNTEVCVDVATLTPMAGTQASTNSEFMFQLTSSPAAASLRDVNPAVRILAVSTPVFGLARPIIAQRGTNSKVAVCINQVYGSPLKKSYVININYQEGTARQGTDIMVKSSMLNVTLPRGFKVGTLPVCLEIADVRPVAGSRANLNTEFSLSLSAPSSDVALNVETAPVRILAVSTPLFGFSNSIVHIQRGGSSMDINACVQLVGGVTLTKAIVVNVRTVDGTAKSGMDFTIVSSPAPPAPPRPLFNFPIGHKVNEEICQRVATLRNVPNARARMDTQFSLRMSSTDNEVGIRDSQATVQIQGQLTPTFSFSNTRIIARRGGKNEIRACVRLVGGPTLPSAYSISIGRMDGTARNGMDYTFSAKTLMFPMGSKINTEKCETVASIRATTIPQSQQFFTLSMTSSNTDIVIKDGVATVLIIAPSTPVFAFSKMTYFKQRDGTEVMNPEIPICVQLVDSPALTKDFTVTVLHEDGTAKAGTDFSYVAAMAEFSFKRGAKVNTQLCQNVFNIRTQVDAERNRSNYQYTIRFSSSPDDIVFREEKATVRILGTEGATVDPVLAQQALTLLIALSFFFYILLFAIPIVISCILFICYCGCACCKMCCGGRGDSKSGGAVAYRA